MAQNAAAVELGTFNDTTFSIGGYVKADAMFTDRTNRALNDANESFLVPALIPLEGAQDADNVTRYSVRESRINFGTSTPSRLGEVRTFIEMDFLEERDLARSRLVGNTTPRLRHAFVSVGPWLVGQTWGTFYDVSSLPEALDFIGPVGTVFNRNLQVRYTHDMGMGNNMMFALEQPFTTLVAEDALGTQTSVGIDEDGNPIVTESAVIAEGGALRSGRDDRFPDIVARYNTSGDWGNGSLAVMARNIRADRSSSTDAGADIDDDKWGAAASLSANVKTVGKDTLKFQFNVGNALGRYISLNAFPDAFVDENGRLDLVTVTGGFVGYQRWWTDRTRSSLIYSYVEADNPSSAPDAANKSIQSVHVNLIHSPISNLDVGIEYLWAERNIEGRVARADGRSGRVGSGDMNRVQVSAKYSF
nr:DcaP family trimeric outer membrane transporter [Methylonatrum kenyense]